MPPITAETIRAEIQRLEQTATSPRTQFQRALKEIAQEAPGDAIDIVQYITTGWGLGEKPYPVQRFILKLIYGLPLDDAPLDYLPQKATTGEQLSKDIVLWDKFREIEVGRYNETQFIDYLYQQQRCNRNLAVHNENLGKKENLIVLRIGRRGSKTTLSQWIAAYELYRLTRIYSPQDYYHIRNDQPIRITLVATSEDQARELLAPARGAIQRAPLLKQYVIGDSQDHMHLTTQRNKDLGITASSGVNIRAAACSARSLRGPANILVLLEEYGFFNFATRDSNKSDREIYKAVAPSTGDFIDPQTHRLDSMIMIVSTPQSRESHMYELEQGVWDKKLRGLVLWLPTQWINQTYPSSTFRQEFAIDPIGFNQEYDAEYIERITSAFSYEVVERCREEPYGNYALLRKGETTWMGMDLGLKNDGTAIFVVAANETGECRLVHKEIIRVDLPGWEKFALQALDGSIIQELDVGKVTERAEELFNYYGCLGGVYDQWSASGVKSNLKTRARELFQHVEFNQTNNDHLARHTLAMVNQARLKIYEVEEDWRNEESLIWELNHLQRLESAGEIPKLRIQASNIRGRHDDQYSALSRALWCARIGTEDNVPPLTATIAPVHQRIVESLKQKVETIRRQQKFQTERSQTRNFPRPGRRW